MMFKWPTYMISSNYLDMIGATYMFFCCYSVIIGATNMFFFGYSVTIGATYVFFSWPGSLHIRPRWEGRSRAPQWGYDAWEEAWWSSCTRCWPGSSPDSWETLYSRCSSPARLHTVCLQDDRRVPNALWCPSGVMLITQRWTARRTWRAALSTCFFMWFKWWTRQVKTCWWCY